MGAEAAGTARRRRLRTGLGTFLAVEAAAQSPEQAEAAIEAAFEAMAAVDLRMHPTREESDLARINTAAARLLVSASTSDPSPPCPSPAIRVHPTTWELLKLAKRLNELSDGVFDPCLPCRPGVLADVELLPRSEVRCRAPVKLDFGGLAKGFAIDRAVEALIHHGCSAGLVNAGGDLRAFGSRPEIILVRGSAGELHSLPLANASLAVSRVNGERRPQEHSGYYLRTPSAAVARSGGAAVLAGRAVVADALTKCALLCTERQLERIFLHFGAEAGQTQAIRMYRLETRETDRNETS